MFLCVDIGNTNTDLGIFHQGSIALHRKIPTATFLNRGDPEEKARAFLEAEARGVSSAPEGAAVASVVAGLGEVFISAFQALFQAPIHQVDADWDLGLSIEYENPAHVGIDRLLAASAAFAETEAGRGAIVADIGTAITVDAVDPSGTFLGGLILPGIRMGLDALHARTSLLPTIEIAPDPPLLGKSTPDCMRSGAVHGTAALLDGLFDRIETLIGKPLTGFLTGGDGGLLAPHLSRFTRCDPDLVLRGIYLAHQRRGARASRQDPPMDLL